MGGVLGYVEGKQKRLTLAEHSENERFQKNDDEDNDDMTI